MALNDECSLADDHESVREKVVFSSAWRGGPDQRGGVEHWQLNGIA